MCIIELFFDVVIALHVDHCCIVCVCAMQLLEASYWATYCFEIRLSNTF